MDNNPDKPIWVDNEGNCKNYSTANVWRDIRGNGAKVVWKDIVWHAHCIPKHTFILWLAVKGKLSTQDKMSKWYPNKVFECSLCQNEADSHEHLFFKCEYAQRVWKKVCIIARINIKDEQWEEIIKAMSLRYKKKNLLGIISRLCFAAVVYYIWQERNWRLFNNCKRTELEIFEAIYDEVRARLMSIPVKDTKNIASIEEEWNIKFTKKM
ncbi:RNA-directed DNA polymerase, eukaryota, reverse transcriptase zinc-binding domain protein [Tanacetum coccineum]